MQLDPSDLHDVRTRLRRIEGQVGGLIRMIDDGRDCRELITQLAATSTALDRVGFKILATGLTRCLAEPGPQSDLDRGDLEKLFLVLA